MLVRMSQDAVRDTPEPSLTVLIAYADGWSAELPDGTELPYLPCAEPAPRGTP